MELHFYTISLFQMETGNVKGKKKGCIHKVGKLRRSFFLHDEDNKAESLDHELDWAEIQNTNLHPVLYFPVSWAGLGLACRA